jgi:hypothetical protein
VRVWRSYLVCGGQRTGSWLLCHALQDTGVLGVPAEYFHRGDEQFWTDRWGAADEDSFLRAVQAQPVTANGVRGSMSRGSWTRPSVPARAGAAADAAPGRPPHRALLLAYSESILKFYTSLKLLGRFQIPVSQVDFDSDFGSSRVFFRQYVGACNKNGIFYALNQTTMQLAWQQQVRGPAGDNAEYIGAPDWNGSDLFFATPSTKIGSVTYRGRCRSAIRAASSSGRPGCRTA